MSERLVVELSPALIKVDPSGAPGEAIVTIRNLSGDRKIYTIAVEGLAEKWVTISPTRSTELFDNDSDEIRVIFQPSKGSGLYPFTVHVTDGKDEETAEGTLDVQPSADYRLDLIPRQQVGRRRGTYTLQVTNAGKADLQLALEANDEEDACLFRFPKEATPASAAGPPSERTPVGGKRSTYKGEVKIAAGSRIDLALVVEPVQRPWVGAEHSYDFTVTATPQDARGDSQEVAGQFIHRPLLRSVPQLPPLDVLSVVLWLVILGLSLVLLMAVWIKAVPWVQAPYEEAARRVCMGIRNMPVLGALCPPIEKPQVQNEPCEFKDGFGQFKAARPNLIGDCLTQVKDDGHGNTYQTTSKGVLFWQKSSNIITFSATDGKRYTFVGGELRLEAD